MTVGKAIAGGMGWTIAARWGIRGVGVVSTLILARVLVPEDFGVVAMATLAVGLIEVFTETGLILYLIRHQNPERAYFDTVWSLRTIVGIAFGALIFLVAPFASSFFNEPRVDLVMKVLALNPIFAGLQNPGMIWFRKNMQFSKDFQFLVAQKIAAFTITISVALIFRTYWALVAGIISGSVAGLLLSFLMHDFRPRWDLSRAREVWGFSLWMLGQHLLNFFNDRIDEFIVGRFRGTQSVGLYSVAADVGAAPIREITGPAARVLFPAFSKIAGDQQSVKVVFEKVFGASTILCLALGPGTALVASDFVAVILGGKWSQIVPVMQYLALAAAVTGLSQPYISVLPALGQERLSTILLAIRLPLLTISMVFAALESDIAGIAAARLGALAATFFIIMFFCAFLSDLKIYPRTVWRPAIASLVMAVVVTICQEIGGEIAAVRLALAISLGGVTYVGVILGLWVLAGKPPSVESDLCAYFSKNGASS